MSTDWKLIQRWACVPADGVPGPLTAAAIVAKLGLTPRKHGLTDPDAFFKEVGKITGRLVQVQVDTINGLLSAASHWPLGLMAYGLATAWHEARFIAQEEWGRGKGRPYGKPGKYGQAPYGRGLVQLTHDYNYEWADKELGLNGALLKDFSLALRPDYSAAILVKGMEQGAFNPKGKGLAHYIDGENPTRQQYIAARITVNLNDKAAAIADLAVRFQAALEAGEWS